MRKLIVFVLLAFPCFGQKQPASVVWELGHPNMTVRYIQGRAMEHLDDRGRVFDVYEPVDSGFVYKVLVAFQNNTDKTLDLNPEKAFALPDGAVNTEMVSVDADGVINAEYPRPNTKELIKARDQATNMVFRRNSVAPKDYVIGVIYIAKPGTLKKGSQLGIFAFEVDGTQYIFHFLKGRVPEEVSR